MNKKKVLSETVAVRYETNSYPYESETDVLIEYMEPDGEKEILRVYISDDVPEDQKTYVKQVAKDLFYR